MASYLDLRITHPSAVTTFVEGDKHGSMRRLINLLEELASGSTYSGIGSQIIAETAGVRATGTVTIASTAVTGSAVLINGVSISGTQLAARVRATLVTPVVGNVVTLAAVAFTAAQLNARGKATLVAPVATNSLTIGATVFTAAQYHARGRVTCTTVVAGNTLTIGATTFTAQDAAVTPGDATFCDATGDAETATSLAAQINAHAVASTVVSAVASTDKVYIRALASGTGGNAIAFAKVGAPIAITTMAGAALAGAFIEGGAALAADGWDAGLGATDTQVATGLASQINANPTAGALVGAISAAGVVHIRAIAAGTAGNAIAFAKSGAPITITATGGGALAGAFIEGGVAQGVANWDYGDSDTQGAAALAAVVNASTNAAISGIITATSAAGVVTFKAVTEGTGGNSLTVTKTGAPITLTAQGGGADTGVFQNGAAYSGDQFDSIYNGGTVEQVAASLAAAINRSATALIVNVVTATSASGVCTITSSDPGIGGNEITLSCTGTGPTASGARLTGGSATTITTEW